MWKDKLRARIEAGELPIALHEVVGMYVRYDGRRKSAFVQDNNERAQR